MIESRRSYLWRWSLPGLFTSFLINNSYSACAQGQYCPIAWVRAKRLGEKRSPFGFCLWRKTYLDIEKYLEDWEKWKWTCESLSHVWLCNPIDCSPPVHGILQARILEWVAIPFSRVSSQPRGWTRISHIAGRFFTIWAWMKVLLFILSFESMLI